MLLRPFVGSGSSYYRSVGTLLLGGKIRKEIAEC